MTIVYVLDLSELTSENYKTLVKIEKLGADRYK